MVSTNTICFEGISRVYRNAVLEHVRKVLKSRYGEEWEQQIRSTFKREWETINSQAALRRNTGELSAPLRDDLDVLGVNHFYNLFDRYFDELFSVTHGLTDVERKQTKQNVLVWSRAIKNLRDPVLGHPSEKDVPQEDAFVMLDSARRVLQQINNERAANRLAELRDSVMNGSTVPTDDMIPPTRTLESSTLPPRETIAQTFVGRQSELAELNDWLADPFGRVWLLAGDGGKGKTAIAYEFAVATVQDPPSSLEIVIWLSAKSRRFESGQFVDIENPDFWDQASAVDQILRAYGVDDIDDMDMESKEQECRTYLSELPALIILDDVDSLEDEQLKDTMSFFVYRTPQSMPCKVLLTSRRAPMGMPHTQVTGFEPRSNDGRLFVKSRVQMYDLDVNQFPAGVADRVLEACDGSPLFIQDLLRLCKVGESPRAAIKRWRNSDGETARRYALGREFEMLSTSAQKVLISCALYPGSASLPEIQTTTELSTGECDLAIQELQNLFLLPQPGFIEEVPRFELNLNTRRLVMDVQSKTDLATRIKKQVDVITGKNHSTPEYRGKIGHYIRQAVSLIKLDKHSEAEETLTRSLEIYPENADLHGTLGWVYKNWEPRPRYTDAIEHFVRASDLKSSKEDTYRHWWEIEQGRQEWSSAAEAAERGLETPGSSHRLAYMAGYARSQLAKDLLRQSQFSRAEQEARKAEGHLKDVLIRADRTGAISEESIRRTHRAIALNYEHLVRISQFQQASRKEKHFLRMLANSLERWKTDCPDDPNTASESQRLFYWFPNLKGLDSVRSAPEL